jgi:chromosome segregation ATPase
MHTTMVGSDTWIQQRDFMRQQSVVAKERLAAAKAAYDEVLPQYLAVKAELSNLGSAPVTAQLDAEIAELEATRSRVNTKILELRSQRNNMIKPFQDHLKQTREKYNTFLRQLTTLKQNHEALHQRAKLTWAQGRKLEAGTEPLLEDLVVWDGSVPPPPTPTADSTLDGQPAIRPAGEPYVAPQVIGSVNIPLEAV